MKNIKDQFGCHDCSHVFVKSDYDDGNAYYCTSKAPTRPPCGSVLMKEDSCDIDDEGVRHKRYDDWNKWSKNRNVQEYQVCDDWEKANK